jgi:hypothetical protein
MEEEFLLQEEEKGARNLLFLMSQCTKDR